MSTERSKSGGASGIERPSAREVRKPLFVVRVRRLRFVTSSGWTIRFRVWRIAGEIVVGLVER